MIIDRNKKLDPAGMRIVLAKEFERVQATGLINDSNKEFYLSGDYIPFYPASHKDIIVATDDLTAETLKTATYTAVPITSIKTSTIDGVAYDAGVELTTAPTTAGADSVHLSGYAQCWMRITQDLSPTIDRDSEEIVEIGVSDKIKTLGARSREISFEVIMTVDMLRFLTDTWYEPKASQTGVAEGLELLTERDAPLKFKGFIPVVYDGEEIQRYLLSDVELQEDMPAPKAGDTTVKLTINAIISDPIDVLRETAA